jgi:hypothetical protein
LHSANLTINPQITQIFADPDSLLGSARASRAGDRALAIAPFALLFFNLFFLSTKELSGEGARKSTRGRVRSPIRSRRGGRLGAERGQSCMKESSEARKTKQVATSCGSAGTTERRVRSGEFLNLANCFDLVS